jgi:hypothetical protein
MKTTQLIAGALAGSMMLTALGFAAGNALAQSSAAVREDQAQSKADTSARARERAQLRLDEKTLGADINSGKMAAESDDSEKVYKDRQTINSQRKDLARDKPGSLQEKSDRSALQREQETLKSDANAWAADAKSGKMAAESTDAEKIYRDQQAIKGQGNAIAADRRKLNADRNN